MRQHREIGGACHCGNIRFVLRWPIAVTELPVRMCSCSFCKKHNGAWTSHRDSGLLVQIDDLSSVSKYNFGTKTADFFVCSRCGVVPLIISEIDANNYAVVNVNAFDRIGSLSLSSSATDFDGEGVGDRLDRRKRNWISEVQFSA